MATTPIEIPKLPEGLTLTCDVYPRASDTANQSGITLTEETNRKGTYSGSVTGAASGISTFKVKSSSVVIAEVTSYILDTTASFIVEDAVDVFAISNDQTAADNLESQYDTTGLTGDTFPATQSQISSITNAGSAVNTTQSTYLLTTGTQSSGTAASTGALDGTNHEHTSTTGSMDLYYEFAIGRLLNS